MFLTYYQNERTVMVHGTVHSGGEVGYHVRIMEKKLKVLLYAIAYHAPSSACVVVI